MNKMLKNILTIVLLLGVQGAFGQQTYDFSEEAIIERLKKDVYTLASDEMEGREAGTKGERLAADYIKDQMKQIGLEPMFGESFLQEFTFPGQWIVTPDNYLSIGNKIFHPGDDYVLTPLSGDASITAKAMYAGRGMDNFLGTNDYDHLKDVKGKILFIEYYLPQDIERESGLTDLQIFFSKLETAIAHGAAGVVFVNTFEGRANPRIPLRGNVTRMDIPVVFANLPVYEAFKKKPDTKVRITTRLEREEFTAVNVAGYLNNNAPTTVVIGGHFDHLGWGNSGSRTPGEAAIHYGADDNASGTAGVLEAARYLIHSDLKGNNYIFIGFTAEEKGLLGSRHFAESDAYDMEKVNYMFNYDMIGRLEDYNMSLIGTGTSPKWDALIEQVVPDHFNIRKSPGGLGGSDHSAFYMKNIPVLFFFTGIHDDYHRPGDTPEKVNYKGAQEIIAFSLEMIAQLDQAQPLEFTPTPVAQRQRSRSDGATLGLMPDHAFDGQGLRVQAVVEDRPAQKAGLQAGDVIVRINDTEVQEIHSYMEALANLQRGQTIQVVVIRQEQELLIPVEL